jgi:hypothetical protein
MKQNNTLAGKQKTIDFREDPAYPETPVEESDSQIAINMVLALKEKIDQERRFWKTFATVCGLIVVVLSCVHFYNEKLRNDALMNSREITDPTWVASYLQAENESLEKENENLARKKIILTHGIEEFLATRNPEIENEGFDVLRRALEKSRMLVTKKPR